MLGPFICIFHCVSTNSIPSIGCKGLILTIVKRQHSPGFLPYPTPENSHLLGVGIGAFAAAAISSSEDVIRLVPAAVHAIVVALHTGLRADQEAKSIQGPTTSQSWAMTVAGTSIKETSQMLERFNYENVGRTPQTFAKKLIDNIYLGPPSLISCIRQQHFSDCSHNQRSACCVVQAACV